MQAENPNPMLSPELLKNPYPFYASLREQAPVHYVEPLMGSYVMCRHEDVNAALKNYTLFSADAMRAVTTFNKALRQEVIDLLQPDHVLMAADPPLHTHLRGMVGQFFVPRQVTTLEPTIRALVSRLLDAMLAKDEPELIADLATQLPLTLISEMLGIEPERCMDFKRWTDDIVAAVTPAAFAQTDIARLEASMMAFHDYMQDIVQRRRREPRNDVISALVQASDKGGVLSQKDIIFFCQLLLASGNATTTNLLGNGIIALLRNPSEWERLVADPSLVPGAVEEMLRYDPPLQAALRRTTQDTTVSGHPVPANALVLMLLGAANRDPRKFADPERFDITREAQGHMSFGSGIHACVGAPLARLEVRIVLEELLRRVRRLEFAPGQEESLDWGTNLIWRGPKALRLKAEPL